MLPTFLQCPSVVALAFGLLCANPAAAQRSRVVLRSRIDSIVMAHQAKNRVPVVSLHIGSPSGVTLYAKTYREARILPSVAGTARTRFHLASVSMAYASVVIHRLSEQGLIDLALPIGRYLRGPCTDTGAAPSG